MEGVGSVYKSSDKSLTNSYVAKMKSKRKRLQRPMRKGALWNERNEWQKKICERKEWQSRNRRMIFLCCFSPHLSGSPAGPEDVQLCSAFCFSHTHPLRGAAAYEAGIFGPFAPATWGVSKVEMVKRSPKVDRLNVRSL